LDCDIAVNTAWNYRFRCDYLIVHEVPNYEKEQEKLDSTTSRTHQATISASVVSNLWLMCCSLLPFCHLDISVCCN